MFVKRYDDCNGRSNCYPGVLRNDSHYSLDRAIKLSS